MKTEILAPVGGTEQLKAAVRCGADAVYLGTGQFNARRNAENFDEISLSEAVSYSHAYGVKVYLTLNTLIKDSEVNQITDELEKIALSGVDAVIVQDLGVMKLIKNLIPDMPIHASTQMTIHNISGAVKLKELGFSRIVLARELSFIEIKKFIDEADIDFEVFVHGAHCMSVSGACYISSVLGERSGNRGLCAQPCRLNFRANNREYALSLKDMSYIEHLNDLVRIGVASFKIEGRMKRAEYVAAAVTACRQALNHEQFDMQSLQAVFSRDGFTDGYYTAKRDLSMFGRRTDEDIASTKEVLSSIASVYNRNETQRIPIDASFIAKKGEQVKLYVTDGLHEASVSGIIPLQAESKPLEFDSVFTSLSKTGGTPFLLTEENLKIDIDGDLFIPVSELNLLRRKALDNLYEQRCKLTPYFFSKENAYKIQSFLKDSVTQAKKNKIPAMRFRFASTSQINNVEDAEFIYLPMIEVLQNKDIIETLGSKLIVELPALIFACDEDEFLLQLKNLKSLGVEKVSADNIGQLKAAKDIGFSVYGGYGLNITNSLSLSEYESYALKDSIASFELSLSKIKELKSDIPVGILSYGFLPLMKFRTCPYQSGKGCCGCNQDGLLTDRKNKNFNLICENKKYSVMLNSVPLYMADCDLRGIDFAVLYFTKETSEECIQIINAYKSKKTSDNEYTRGLYFREIK